jgi:hypothetical protein
MPIPRGPGRRELQSLSLVGGFAGRRDKSDNCPWRFDAVCHMITPRDSDNYSASSHEFNYNTDELSASSTECNTEMESGWDTDSEHIETHGIKSLEGNRLINLPALTNALENIATCKHCMRRSNRKSFESFLSFCAEETKNFKRTLDGMSLIDKLVAYERNFDVSFLFDKWVKYHQNDIEQEAKPLVISELTYGLASEINITCTKCITDSRFKKHQATIHPEKTAKYMDTNSELCQYAINLQFCFALQSMGVGGEHAAILTAFLDLQESQKWPRQFSVLEKFTNAVVESVKCNTQEEATEEKVIATMDLPNDSVPQFLLEAAHPLRRVQASFDMGWQVRSSGGKYGSPTGHGLLIGAISKKVMDSVIFNKKCGVCTKYKNQRGSTQDIRTHLCVKNYDGSSKSMEAAALTKMLTRMPEEKSVSICTIISDDDSNGRAKARRVENGGELPNHVEEPTFFADPSHRKRVFARPIYNLASLPMKKSAVTKGLAAHLKYCYGACVKRNRHLPAQELSTKVFNILEHICGEHKYCDSAWCYDKKATEEGKLYCAPADHRLDRMKHPDTYNQLKEIFQQYASVRMMQYCNHPYDTQTNEALNQSIANVSPKSVCYSSLISLYSRIALVIGTHNQGYKKFYNNLFSELGITMSLLLSNYLERKDEKKGKKKVPTEV